MKRIFTLLASLALVGSGLHILPAAAAEEAPAVPEVVNIEDPYGDANTQSGDQVTPADGSTVSDLGKVWFSHDAENFNVHILTEGPPGTNTVGIQFVVTLGEGGCAVFSGYYKGLTYLSDGFSRLVDGCNKLDPIDGTFTFGEGPDGQGLATMTIPRAGTPLLADGSNLTAPVAQSWVFAGGEQLTPSGYRGVRQRIDDTKAGTDYALAGGQPVKTPPGKNPVPGKKKGCDNGKGKKRGCEGKGPKKPKPGKPSAQCAPYVPGEAGAEAETLVLTDAATEAAPIEVPNTFGPAIPGETSDSKFVNVQVDTAAKEAGLYAYIEFTPRNDYDLNLLYDDGSYAAQSHGFNPLIEINDVPLPVIGPFSSTGNGGESTDHSEKLVGIKTPDCGGYTVDVTNYAGPGGDVTLQLWLGEAKTDPSAPGEVLP